MQLEGDRRQAYVDWITAALRGEASAAFCRAAKDLANDVFPEGLCQLPQETFRDLAANTDIDGKWAVRIEISAEQEVEEHAVP